ncbi:hypothetical protein CCY99_05565 [Helicobacter sp. 16-1353]|uniref:hypothetical protein n=1 Tax=Helicobacter sp. 16-1353 TaxID=2004996 RepID=UPI000DCD52CE|nr:hypothetical protein [Helicobacter sp. 16-1353]RAX53849.1 hypothetical protein CCY99_05565 [Helicobacter sp. 16-1353]
MAKGSLNLEQLKSLCDYKNGIYIQKSGNEYIESLSKVFAINNKNDKPFSLDDIKSQPTLEEFSFSGKDDFIFICNLSVEPMSIDKDSKRKNERIKAINFVGDKEKRIFEKALGVAYILTCKIGNREHIIKFGQSRTIFKKRLGSYNCGVVNNWRTASTTNIKMLQSMVTNRTDFNLYLYDCSDEVTIIEWRGEKSVPFASPKSLAVEDIMLKKFIQQFSFKPLANIQTDATKA